MRTSDKIDNLEEATSIEIKHESDEQQPKKDDEPIEKDAIDAKFDDEEKVDKD